MFNERNFTEERNTGAGLHKATILLIFFQIRYVRQNVFHVYTHRSHIVVICSLANRWSSSSSGCYCFFDFFNQNNLIKKLKMYIIKKSIYIDITSKRRAEIGYLKHRVNCYFINRSIPQSIDFLIFILFFFIL